MTWILNNWLYVIIAIAIAVVVSYGISVFFNYPNSKKIAKLKEWLLYAVTEAEKELGGGTGQIKLRYVYDMFIVKFPYLAKVISFESFSKLVDEALDKFRNLLKTNSDIKNYVEGDK